MAEPAAASDRPDFVAVVCAAELWDGEMEAYDVAGTEVLLVRLDGSVHAYHGSCPHQGFRLAEGSLDGSRLTCAAHGWEFDLRTGEGVNPRAARLTRHAVRTVDGVLLVSRLPVSDTGGVHCGRRRPRWP